MKCLVNAYAQAEQEISIYNYNYSGLLLKILLNIEMDIYFLLKYLSSAYDNSIFYGGLFHTLTYKYFFINYFNINPKIDILENNNLIKLEKTFDFFEGI